MTYTKVCPRCGAESTAKPFIENFCRDCYPLEVTVDRICIEQCAHCHRIRQGNTWITLTPRILHDIVVTRIRPRHYEHATVSELSKESTVSLDVTYRVGKERVSRRIAVPLSFKSVTCPTCSKMHGRYHEAIIQLRGDTTRIHAEAERIASLLGKEIVESRDVQGGKDLYVLFKKSAEKALRHCGMIKKVQRSWKLVGEKEGVRLYRITFCVRL